MSLKGKEKAVEVIPTVIIDDDDEATDFFVKKRKKRTITRYSPIRSPSPVLILDDSEDEDGKARLKRSRPKKATVNILPSWARASSTQTNERKKSRSVGRGSTEERKGRNDRETITIESSPEKEPANGRKVLELTPPPEMTETKKAEIAQAIQSAVALKPRGTNGTTQVDHIDDPGSRLPSKSAIDDSVKAVFRMVAPPERRTETSSAKAIEFYEKRRLITMGRTQPLEYAVKTLATQIRKAFEEIIVTYNGDRIYSTLLTPQTLGIEYDAEFVCYEKEAYERMEEEARESRRPADNANEEERYDSQRASQSSDPPIEVSDKVRISLVGEFGAVTATVAPHVTAASLCKYYLAKSGGDKSLLNDIRLSWDGETVEPDTKFGDLDAESGDQIDVKRI